VTQSVTLDDIQQPIAGHLTSFRSYFKKATKTEVFLLDQMMRYLLRTKGKELRPSLVFHSARLCGDITERSYVAATMIELLHTATLIHDDVVDEADERRGFLSISAIWKNKAAVLLGDFLLSKGLLVALDRDEFALLKVLSVAVKRMSEGELRQLKASKLQNMNEDRYFKVISGKTASLISACCECGAISASDDPDVWRRMREFGEALGIAFQIRDDLFDYETNDTGKTAGADILEGKMTLPMIYALQNASMMERLRIRRVFKNEKKSPEQVAEVIAFVHAHRGVELTRIRMNAIADEARAILNTFPEGEARTTLDQFLNFVVTRTK
jgi:octaprenyl-diphosphate synthase